MKKDHAAACAARAVAATGDELRNDVRDESPAPAVALV